MKHLELFAGIGGISLAAEWAGFEAVAFCEREPFCQKVLSKHWPDIPIFDDVKTLDRQMLEERGIESGAIELITGGFPCQPYSIAGKRGGTGDDRDLWPEMFRLIKEIRPRWVVGENVAHFANMELDRTFFDLENIGYTGGAFILPAVSVGANHRRDRTFIVAHSDDERQQEPDATGESNRERFSTRENNEEYLCYTDSEPKLQTDKETGSVGIEWQTRDCFTRKFRGEAPGIHWEVNQSPVCGVDDGVPGDMDRLKSLGNAVVPQQIYPIFKAIKILS